MAYLHDPKFIEIEGKKHRVKDFEKQAEHGVEPFRLVFLLSTGKVDTDTAYAFHTQKSANAWLKERDLAGWLREFRRTPKVERTKAELADALRFQEAELKRSTELWEQDVARIGIDPSEDIRGFCRALENYDPLRGPTLASVVLFEHCPFSGRPLRIPSYWQVCDLRPYAYDRVVSSAITSPFRGCFLWDEANGPPACPPGRMPLGVMLGPRRAVSCLTTLGFNDRTRSVEA